jgi:transitional endoplasmic reticulum ATPase
LIDPALLRPGRFDELIYVGAPSEEGRLHILKIHTRDMPLADDVDLAGIAAAAERYTGADLEDVVRRAGLIAIRKRGPDATNVNAQDFADAFEDSRATVTEQMEEDYLRMRGELKKRAMEVRPTIGFIHEGMLESTRPSKHTPDT